MCCLQHLRFVCVCPNTMLLSTYNTPLHVTVSYVGYNKFMNVFFLLHSIHADCFYYNMKPHTSYTCITTFCILLERNQSYALNFKVLFNILFLVQLKWLCTSFMFCWTNEHLLLVTISSLDPLFSSKFMCIVVQLILTILARLVILFNMFNLIICRQHNMFTVLI
jgi:hypothetical protein